MKQPSSSLPALMDNASGSMRATSWGGMACSYYELSAGTDFAPVLKGLPDDACPCPHWGYVVKGAIRVCYTDGREEVLRCGEMYYLPPGHTALFEEDSACVEFSPQREYDEVISHAGLKTSV